MTRQNRTSISNSKKAKPQSIPDNLSPNEILDTSDPGDETQHRYRYQHAYGVILLIAAICNKKPYIAIWCEHHEDLLGERLDGLYDGYQIKTQEPKFGLWELTNEPLKASIKRFVELDQKFPGKIKELFFVSNVGYENSKARNKLRRSPTNFLQSIYHATSQDDLVSPFDETFETLRVYCDCNPSNLMSTLKKLKLVQGPDLDSFEAVIAQEHLPQIRECNTLSAPALATLRDELIAQVYKASSLSTGDPSRHWCCIYGEDHLNPKLTAKRIATESTIKYISKIRQHLQETSEETNMLSKRLEETLLLYLKKSFNYDQVAKLDQAGESDTDRSTLLRQVFVDLELKPRNDPWPKSIKLAQLIISDEEEVEQTIEMATPNRKRALSAMKCFLEEPWPMIVIIGGPGQGKSTLGQYLAQVHRAKLLDLEEDLYPDIGKSTTQRKKFKHKTLRIPFRIVLKYFAQWLADSPTLDTVEAYIAEQISKGASRPGEVSAPDIQEIMRSRATLIIFDGLDEVTEPELRNRVLNNVEEFLERATHLKADLQVITTSRPTGYNDQFDPKRYWHLELQPMSVSKVLDYASRWADVKVTVDEERRRIKDTLKECLQEKHTRLLLTTPLQVTIVLLIIKDGGHPPAQREGLFQNYWNTILRREKSKAKGVIRTDESLLFNLHAYLGYLLHRKSASANVDSLLSIEEFEEVIYQFLKASDKYSSQDTLRQLAAQMVEEARYRLVLLVEPVPELFGFELRSLQEFFAGAFLVQTAEDTHQRFERLRAIARSEHWRNVALFFAGRIVRNFSGEAVNILEQVCRPIDREQPDVHLRRGAWLALDIAADGIFATNRNLQYSALEYALTILNTGIMDKDWAHLESALRKLSHEDRSDILGRLLKQKQASLTLSRLSSLLGLYKNSSGVQQDFIQGLEVLLSSNQQEHILSALQLAFEFEVEPHWLAKQMYEHYNILAAQENAFKLFIWCRKNFQYAQRVMSVLALEKSQVNHLLNNIPIFHAYSEEELPTKLKTPITLAEQIISFLQYVNINVYLLLNIRHPFTVNKSSEGLEMRYFNIQIYDENTKLLSRIGLFETLDQLIERTDLLPRLKLVIWMLYFSVHEPTVPMVATFLDECRVWTENKLLPESCEDYQLLQSWPLLSLALKYQLKGDQNIVMRLQPYLNKPQEISISQQIQATIQNLWQKLSPEKAELNLSIQSEDTDNLPELALISEKLGISISELTDTYILYIIGEQKKYSSAFIQHAFSLIEKNLDHSKIIENITRYIAHQKWSMNQETFNQGQRLLTLLLERLPQRPNALNSIVIIFFKLLAFSRTTLELAPSLLLALTNYEKELNAADSFWFSSNIIEDIPVKHFVELANFTKDENRNIQQGSSILWEMLIKISFRTYAYKNNSFWPKFGTVRLDWQTNLPFLKDVNVAKRIREITLLTFSEHPITEARYVTELLNAIAQAQDRNEIIAWANFVQHVPISKSKESAWKRLLETILTRPQTYNSKILNATMQRYTALIGDAGPGIMGDEIALGLPKV